MQLLVYTFMMKALLKEQKLELQRGELEITALKIIFTLKMLKVETFGRGMAWLDTVLLIICIKQVHT